MPENTGYRTVIGIEQFISDIAGQDIQAHNNSSKKVIMHVRNWLRTASRRETIPGGSIIWRRYRDFRTDLPQTAREYQLTVEDLIFNDYSLMVTRWLETKAKPLSHYVYYV